MRVEDVGPSADLRGALSVVKGSRGRVVYSASAARIVGAPSVYLRLRIDELRCLAYRLRGNGCDVSGQFIANSTQNIDTLWAARLIGFRVGARAGLLV